MNRYSPNELLKGIRKRDNTIISYIYTKYYQSVMHFVMANNGTSEDAKDTFQEAMIVVFENIRKDKNFQLESSLQTYLYSVARKIWIKHITRTKSKMTELNESHEYIDFVEPDPFREHGFQYALYQRVFLELPEDCQKILTMVNAGISHKEIANKMGFSSESYIAKRRHFCKEYLIKLIKQHPDFYSDKL